MGETRVWLINENMLYCRRDTLLAYFSEIIDNPGWLAIVAKCFRELDIPFDTDLATYSGSNDPILMQVCDIIGVNTGQNDRIFIGHWLGIKKNILVDLINRPINEMITNRIQAIRAMDALKSRKGCCSFLKEISELLENPLGHDERHSRSRRASFTKGHYYLYN